MLLNILEAQGSPTAENDPAPNTIPAEKRQPGVFLEILKMTHAGPSKC